MYGISEDDIERIDNKIAFQKRYLEKFLETDFESDNIGIYSANLNPKKYFAEINNRVNTLFDNAKDKGLYPVFVTITAPSKFHIKSAKHWCPYSKMAMCDYGDGIEILSHNKTAKALTQIFNKFTNLQIFQKMKKELGFGLTYFRVYEPMESGVPHIHAMLFLPKTYILPVKNKFKSYFSDKKRWGNNKKALDYRYTWSNEKGGAVAYMMKYILKSFQDSDNEKIQHSAYWYIKHRVRRFLSSRTLAPLSVYRKIRYYFKHRFNNDYITVTKMLKNNQIEVSDCGYYIYFHYETEYGVDSEILWAKSTECQLHAKDNIDVDGRIHLRYKKKQKHIDNTDYSSIGLYKPNKSNSFNGSVIIPSKLKDYQLTNYFNKLLDAQDIDVRHFMITKNEMINRGLLDDDIESITALQNYTTKTVTHKVYEIYKGVTIFDGVDCHNNYLESSNECQADF